MPPKAPLVAGIDLGGTNMQIGIVDATNKVVGRTKKKTRPENGTESVIDKIAEGVREACKESAIEVTDLTAVGIGAPGAIDMEHGVVMEAPNLRWNDVPLAFMLGERLRKKPVVVDNDVNVAVYGENKLGVGKNASDVLGVWVGTGIGGGLVLNGKLYYGGFGTAGEIGQIVLYPNAPMGYEILEQCCSRKFVVERLIRLINANHPSILPELAGPELADIGAGTLGKAYDRGDELVRAVVDESADLLGIAISGFVSVLSLPMVILGGGMTEGIGKPYVDRVAKSIRAHVFPDRCREVEVLATKLADDAGLLGAALLAREKNS